jgi:hypothetical protein
MPISGTFTLGSPTICPITESGIQSCPAPSPSSPSSSHWGILVTLSLSLWHTHPSPNPQGLFQAFVSLLRIPSKAFVPIALHSSPPVLTPPTHSLWVIPEQGEGREVGLERGPEHYFLQEKHLCWLRRCLEGWACF